MHIETLQTGRNATNCYIVECDNQGLIIDPGSEDSAKRIMGKIAERECDYKYIVNTHGHFDHIGANAVLQEELDLQIAAHEEAASVLTDPKKNSSHLLNKKIISPPADRILSEGENIEAGDCKFEIYHTPGHSPGSIVLFEPGEEVLFSGDVIFRGGIGRTDLPAGNSGELKESLERIKKIFPLNTRVFPGHGPETTLKDFYDYVYPQIY